MSTETTHDTSQRRDALADKLAAIQSADWLDGATDTIALAEAMSRMRNNDGVLNINALSDSEVEELIGVCDALAEANGYTTAVITYADRWRDSINETYDEDEYPKFISIEMQPGETGRDVARRVLNKAAQCLRNGVPATFTAWELDLVRHLMPAHEVHQSGSVRWVLDNFGEVTP